MATSKKKAAPKKAAPKKAAAAKPAAPKPIKEALSKSGLVAHIAEATAVAAKDVRAVLAALEGAVHGSVSKKGAGSFTLPGLLKI
ncbi:MAG: HU family DNA-binding protein, partial [Pseudoxanthomonas sp.]